jgi:AraC family transcriptional regulator of arabinose operon
MYAMANHLYDAAEEAYHFPAGIMIPGHFIEPFGFHQHRKAGRRDWKFTYTISGMGQFRVDEFIYTCHPGDIAVIPPGIPQHYATCENSIWDYMWVHFVPRSHWLPWLQLPEKENGLLALHVSAAGRQEKIVAAFQRLIQENQGIGAMRENFALNALEEILLVAAEEMAQNANNTQIDPRVQEVLTYLSQNMEISHTIEDLSDRVCLSPSRLAHLYKEQVGESVMETLRKLRLIQAAKLLEFTSRSVTQIASDVGYLCPFNFTRKFKAHFNEVPTVYRKRVQRYG